MNTNLVVDLLSSRSQAQSALQYSTKPWGVNPSKHNLNCKIPYKYWKICLIAIQCSRLGLGHMLIHHAYWVCQIRLNTQHGIHQGSHSLLIRNLHHLNILIIIFFQLWLGIKGHSNGFTILHMKVFENLFEISNLVDVKPTLCTIPFHFHAKEEMQVSKIFHFKLSRKLFLYLQKLVLIIAHQHEIINVDDNEKFDISHLRNIHTKIHITLHKLDTFQESI